MTPMESFNLLFVLYGPFCVFKVIHKPFGEPINTIRSTIIHRCGLICISFGYYTCVQCTYSKKCLRSHVCALLYMHIHAEDAFVFAYVFLIVWICVNLVACPTNAI